MSAPRPATRRGKLGIYWKDVLGKRHFVVAEEESERAALIEKLGAAETIGPASTVAQYAAVWLDRVRARSARLTYKAYEQTVRLHIERTDVGCSELLKLTRPQVKRWVAAQLETGMAMRTLRQHLNTLHALLQEAIEDEIITVNPANAIIRAMRLAKPEPKSLDVDAEGIVRLMREVSADRATAPAIWLMAHLGLRVGEAVGLQWRDVDLEARTMRIERQMHEDGTIDGLKTRRSRRAVDLPQNMVAMLRSMREGRAPGDYVLGEISAANRNGRERVRRALRAACKRAGVSKVWLHGLRHLFASLSLSRGHALTYVQQALGHANVGLTADLYGSHLARRDPQAADDIAAALGTPGAPTAPPEAPADVLPFRPREVAR